MANFLRKNKMCEIQALRKFNDLAKRIEPNGNVKVAKPTCPYCRSLAIDHGTRECVCRECHRHFIP